MNTWITTSTTDRRNFLGHAPRNLQTDTTKHMKRKISTMLSVSAIRGYSKPYLSVYHQGALKPSCVPQTNSSPFQIKSFHEHHLNLDISHLLLPSFGHLFNFQIHLVFNQLICLFKPYSSFLLY